MKKMLSLVLALMMMLSLTLAACAEEDEILVLLPVMDQLINATLDLELSQQNNAYIYTSATQDDVDYFLTLSSLFGCFAKDATEVLQSDYPTYLLVVPGTDFEGYLTFFNVAGLLMLEAYGDFYIPYDELIQTVLSYFDIELKLPSGKGENIVPQFYQCVGRQYYYAGQVGGLSYVFDDALCWSEDYAEISHDNILDYTLYMAMFGYDVTLDMFTIDDNGVFDIVILHYSNGDGEIIVQYDAVNQRASVYYEPGVSWYMPSGSELQDILGM